MHQYCCKQGWGWRVRVRSNINVMHDGGEVRLSEMPALRLAALENATLSSGAVTHIGYLHEREHEEAWFIAMNAKPTRTSTLDYGLRWGIEAMFSDYKTRGFGLEDTQLRRPDRLSKLLLVLAVAMHWVVLTGLHLQKTTPMGSLKQILRSTLSAFTRGLRMLIYAAQTLTQPHPLKIMGW